MPYVSCMYAPENLDDPAEIKEDGHKSIICLDEQGREWFLTEDSQVGDWLEYVSAGGTVSPYSEEDTVTATPVAKEVPRAKHRNIKS
jgi:hypothetical protein